MRPRPPQRPQQQQQQHNNGYPPNPHQHNGFHQNPMMMNPQMMMMMMANPMMGHMNNMPPMQPQFFNNMPQQQQQPLHQFGLPPNPINQFLPNLLGSLQFAAANNNNNNLMGGFQPQLNSFNPPPYRPPPPPPPQNQNQNQNHQLGPPGFSEPRPQVQSIGNLNNTNNSNSKGNHFRNNNFANQQRFKGSGQGSQPYQGNNANKKFGFNKNHKGKGKNNKMPTRVYGSDAGNVDEETKRVYIPNYPPKEVQQWRQARRKNFPTKLNVEKKVKKSDSNCSLDDEAKLRRQQLREVLAKQRELGVEVAEVPSHYLSEQVNGDNNGQFQNKDGKKGRFKHNKRKYGGKDKFDKRRKFQDKDSSQESSTITREPTLLEKLLSADIKRDKIQLLQVFRFMVMNSFFKDSPDEPLKFPSVMVEETGCAHVEEILSDDDDDVDEDGDESDDNSCDEASD